MITTFTGNKLDLLHPDPHLISIIDIAHALSNLCRFTGHTCTFYSVAQHSVHVAKVVSKISPPLTRAALLHDASEAYLGDVSTPLKQLLPDYIVLEVTWNTAIRQKFNILKHDHEIIKKVDQTMAAVEAERFAHPFDYPRDDLFEECKRELQDALPPQRALQMFLSFNQLLWRDAC